VVNRISVDLPGPAQGERTWPIRSGAVPALAPGFVPRQETAAGLEQALAPGHTVALGPASELPAAGSPDWYGCCGKTQLAVYLAETLWRAGELDLLVWISATSEDSVLTGFAQAATAAIGIDSGGDAEALAATFVSWLGQTSRRWLVVLDDLSGSQELSDLLPVGPAGRTLITTTESVAGLGRDAIVSFPLASLSRREALSYLLGRLTEDRGQRVGAIDLVDQLGGEPLALAQVSAVVEGSALSCRGYLEHFARKRVQLAVPDHASVPAAAITWTLSVEQAYRLLPGGPAQPLLVLAALLDGNGMPGTLFTTTAVREYAGAAARGLARPQDGWAAMIGLEQSGLVTIDQATSPPVVRMNSAVQSAIRAATASDLLDRALLAAVDGLLEIWPDAEPDGWLAAGLRSCAQCVVRLAGNLLWTGDYYRLLFRIGESLEDAHLTRLAATHWSGVAEASEQFLGLGHPDAMAASDRLAAAFLADGRAAEALPWFQQVLGDRSVQLGPNHPATIAAATRLGRALLADGRPDDAIAVLERAVSDCGHIHGADHPDTLDARDALAAAYCAAGRSAEGIRQYQRTLADRERIQGATHPAALGTGLRLGDALLAADRVKDAMGQFKRVVSGRERALGADHPQTIAARDRLASAYNTAGRMATALQLYEQARADSERVLGADHPDTLTRRVNLAHAYYAVGRIGDATALLRDTADRCDRVLSSRDPLTRTVRESLANISGG